MNIPFIGSPSPRHEHEVYHQGPEAHALELAFRVFTGGFQDLDTNIACRGELAVVSYAEARYPLYLIGQSQQVHQGFIYMQSLSTIPEKYLYTDTDLSRRFSYTTISFLSSFLNAQNKGIASTWTFEVMHYDNLDQPTAIQDGHIGAVSESHHGLLHGHDRPKDEHIRYAVVLTDINGYVRGVEENFNGFVVVA